MSRDHATALQPWWKKKNAATWEAEVGELIEPRRPEAALSRDLATAFQPGQQSKTPFQNKKSGRVGWE